MIYISISTIPPRLKNLNESVRSLLNQTRKPDKIFINIPYKYKRFSETIEDNQIPKFDSSIVEVTRCEDCGPGTKLLGSLNKLEKNSIALIPHKGVVYGTKDHIIFEKTLYYSDNINSQFNKHNILHLDYDNFSAPDKNVSWVCLRKLKFSNIYSLIIGSIFAGVIGTGFYPIFGNRVWCRFGCPLAAYLGVVQRFKSRFRITTNGGQCISCGNCSTYCEQGIDVRAYAQKGENIIRASCVGCGVCSAVCPRGVLKLENGPEDGRINPTEILLGNDVNLMDLLNKK